MNSFLPQSSVLTFIIFRQHNEVWEQTVNVICQSQLVLLIFQHKVNIFKK
jgi:hypothetical protein